MNVLKLIGRESEIFTLDLITNEAALSKIVSESAFLVIGGAGSIGQAVTKEIFKRNPIKLHVVDISENNMVELVRDLRSSYGYIDGDFQTFALDIGSIEYDAFIEADGKYDYVLNLSALKHVRSEKDPFTLMRMIDVNIFNTENKAANPVNMMGASKRIMEMFLTKYSSQIPISTARFANVAFSDGSLLHGFNQRIQKRQPIVAPNDIKRYFVTPKESGELCLMSCIFGENRDVFFPKLNQDLHLITFADIAIRYLEVLGYKPYLCQSEEEARQMIASFPEKGMWPCLFTNSDTTGEKDFEEFFTDKEVVDMNRFENFGVIKNDCHFSSDKIDFFTKTISDFKKSKKWSKEQLVDLFFNMIPDFGHKETGKYLDSKM